MEVWTELKGKTKLGKYYVSNTGKVKKVYKNGKEKSVKGCDNGRGYLYFNHYADGKVLHKYVHRVVAQTYVPNPDKKPEVDHIDGNKTNNHYKNLRWSTKSENGSNRKSCVVGKYSKLKGVTKNKKNGMFIAQIKHHKKHIFLGHFKTDVEAHEAYCTKAKEQIGRAHV